MAWIWFLLSVLLCFHIIQSLLSHFIKRKKLPLGPTGLPIIGHFHLLGKNPHRDLCNLARKHGPIMYMRFGMVPTVVVSSPAGAELILKKHDAIFASRPRIQAAKYLLCDSKNIGFAPYGEHWRDMRKLCTLKLLSRVRVSEFQSMRKAELEQLVGSLKQAANRGEIDLSGSALGLIRDMVCLMVFGRKFADSEMDDQKGFEGVSMDIMELVGRFNVADYIPFLEVFDFQGLTRRMKETQRIFDGFVEKIMEDHVRSKGVKKQAQHFVNTMMLILESGDAGFEIDRGHVKGVLLDMLTGAMDTSSVTVDWALAELIRHPQVMKKLQQELASVAGMDSMIEEAHLDKAEYLDFVIKETLRLHSIAPLLLPRESIEDCVVDGFHIAKKTRIIVNAWAIGRDPDVWPNPEKFCPERFIGGDIDLTGRSFKLIPFGSGRRGCPGSLLGLQVVKLVLAQLVHCFDWELPDGMLPGDLDMSEHYGLVMGRVKHIMASPKYRLRKLLW